MSTWIILLGGAFTPSDRVAGLAKDANMIAADSGVKHAITLGRDPDLWVGDFDSADTELQDRFSHVPKETFPTDKDKTDGEIAIDLALEKGAKRLVLVGAFGGSRTDHAFFHFLAAVDIAQRGVEIILTDGLQEGHPILPGDTKLALPVGSTFSILPLETLCELSIAGARWPLENKDVTFGSSLTLSNEVTGGLAISLKEGRAILITTLAL